MSSDLKRELASELEEWKSSLPENLQNGEKASQIDDAISNLENLADNIEAIDGDNVEFPSMYGWM